MKRDIRTLIVLAVAVVTAGLASFGVYRAIRSIPVREIEVAHTFVVAAARPLQTGARLTPQDLKVVPWPKGAPMIGVFAKIEDVVNRGVIAPVLENEPLVEAKLAPLEAGSGLSPAIPAGMRAISVRVNEVIGVAGFVTPGTRVDVFATLQESPRSQTRVIVSNAQVLAAGTRFDQDSSKPTEAMPSSVVTLLLTPEDAERVVLASTEGQIMLALRNPLDIAETTTVGTRMAAIFGAAETDAPTRGSSEAPGPPPPPRVVTPAKPVIVTLPPPAPVQPKQYTVDTIRGAKRTAETVRLDSEGKTQ